MDEYERVNLEEVKSLTQFVNIFLYETGTSTQDLLTDDQNVRHIAISR